MKEMKSNILKTSFLILIALGLMTGFSFRKNAELSHYIMDDTEMCYHVPNEQEVNYFHGEAPEYYLFLGKSYVGFREALGFKESQGIYNRVNRFGYMGKYQFAKSTLNMLGVYDTSGFLTDAKLQENAFTAYMSKNKWILRREIKRYVGSYVNGVKVTESGIIAAAHLAGAGNVKIYLRSGGTINFSDAFGTSIKHYLKKFSGYDTSFIVANRKPKVI
jgi:hypothetical protein